MDLALCINIEFLGFRDCLFTGKKKQFPQSKARVFVCSNQQTFKKGKETAQRARNFISYSN